MGFNAGTLPNITSCVTKVQSNLNRGTLSATSKPTLTDVQEWLIRAKQELAEQHGFTWKKVFSYMDTGASEYRYALPPDFGDGGYIIRDITQDIRLTVIDPVAFDTLFPDVAGSSSAAPTYCTIKGNELWLSQPASGTNRLELEYDRTGDDTSTTDISYLPELMRFKICDYATYRGFIALERWDAANAYKGEWQVGSATTKKRDVRKTWKALGYKVRPFII
jgi:hypothetical protein